MTGKRPFQFVPCGTPGSGKLYTDELGLKGHCGEDWATSFKEPVYFPVAIDNIIWEADTQTDSSGAIIVVVRSTTPVPFKSCPEHIAGSLSQIKKQWLALGGLYLQFWFVHLHSSVVHDRVQVKTGDLLGYADSTGASSGNHLHWSMKVSDPKSWWYIDGDNGLQGCIDFSPWYENTFVGDLQPSQEPKLPTFTTKMQYGETSTNVFKLQSTLKKLGFFTALPTSFYGDKTAAAILAFQLANNVDNSASLKSLKGRYVGPKTLAALNKLV